MDYMKFVNYHRDTGADITIGAIPYSADRAKDFGLMKIDERRRIQVWHGIDRFAYGDQMRRTWESRHRLGALVFKHGC